MLADDWTSLRDVQYRKIHLYDLDWAKDEDRQLDRCLVAVAKYGGAVAMVRDETKLLKVRGVLREQRLIPAESRPLLRAHRQLYYCTSQKARRRLPSSTRLVYCCTSL